MWSCNERNEIQKTGNGRGGRNEVEKRMTSRTEMYEMQTETRNERGTHPEWPTHQTNEMANETGREFTRNRKRKMQHALFKRKL